MLTRMAGCALTFTIIAHSACAQTPIKIGFVSTFSGPQGQLGEEIYSGFQVALDQLGGKLGGLPIDVLVGDDQTKPDVARQIVDKMIEQDKVDVLTGMLNSSVLLAIARPAFEADKIVISSIAAPSVLAGKQCNPNFFVASPQNDASSEATGHYLDSQGVKRVFLISSNYPAGRDKMVSDKKALRKAIAEAQFDATRGRFRFNTNHIPLTDFYLATVAKDDKGRYVLALGGKILADRKDAYADQCTYPPN
jgi:branched-chain amino acid transport system substrate-binding protein